MADQTSFFSSIFVFFQALWCRFMGSLFSPKWSIDNQPNDVEAAVKILPSPRLELAESQKGLPVNNLIAAINKTALSTPQCGFVDVNETMQLTIGDCDSGNSHLKYVGHDHPSRRASRRQSCVDPMKTRILEDTLRHVQDKRHGIQKTVVITTRTVFPVECSARVEYYHGPTTEACSVKVECYPIPVADVFSARVEHYSGPIIDALSEKPDNSSSFTVVEKSGASYFEELTAVVDVEDFPIHESDDEKFMDVTSGMKSSIGNLQGILESFEAPPGLSEQPSLSSRDPSTPRLKKKHRVQFAMYSEEVPFTPVLERTSKRQKERRQKRRNDLFDVLAQFPDIPTFVPTCPPGRVSLGTRIPEVVSTKYAYRTRSLASPSESDPPTSSYAYGPLSNNWEQTSSPGVAENPLLLSYSG